jgi:hypothetical protein
MLNRDRELVRAVRSLLPLFEGSIHVCHVLLVCVRFSTFPFFPTRQICESKEYLPKLIGTDGNSRRSTCRSFAGRLLRSVIQILTAWRSPHPPILVPSRHSSMDKPLRLATQDLAQGQEWLLTVAVNDLGPSQTELRYEAHWQADLLFAAEQSKVSTTSRRNTFQTRGNCKSEI